MDRKKAAMALTLYCLEQYKEIYEYDDTPGKHFIMDAFGTAITSLEAWDEVLEELGDTNMDILTDEVKEIINEKLKIVEDDSE